MKYSISISTLILGFIIGISFPVNAGTTVPKCTIDLIRDSVTCINNKDKWTCHNVGSNEWRCEGRLTSWTTDCPYCESSIPREIN
jgi:hypothetical protein